MCSQVNICTLVSRRSELNLLGSYLQNMPWAVNVIYSTYDMRGKGDFIEKLRRPLVPQN